MTGASTGYPDQVERKVAELAPYAQRQHNLSPEHLRRSCFAVLEQQLPLRDAIVLREAQRQADRVTPRSVVAWVRALLRISHSVPDSTFRLWIAPLDIAGEETNSLLLAAPTGIRNWVERRYSHLITEALQGTGFTDVAFVSGEAA